MLGYLFGSSRTQRDKDLGNVQRESQSIIPSEFTDEIARTSGKVAAAIVVLVGHAILAGVAVGLTALLGFLFHAISPEREPQLAGVSLSYLLEGTELVMVAVILLLGVASATVMLLKQDN